MGYGGKNSGSFWVVVAQSIGFDATSIAVYVER